MRNLISIFLVIFSGNVFANTCLLKTEPVVQGCKFSGTITSDENRSENDKVWICINYRKIEDSENPAKFIISGRVKAPTSIPGATEREYCELNRCAQAAGESPKDDSCGDYKIFTSFTATPEKTHTDKMDREGYRLDLIVETSEHNKGSLKFAGNGKSVCEVGFIEAQILETKKSEPEYHWPDCR